MSAESPFGTAPGTEGTQLPPDAIRTAAAQPVPPERFVLMPRQPQLPPGQRVQQIIDRYTGPDRLSFLPLKRP